MSTKLTVRPTWTFEIEVLPTLEIGGGVATLDNTLAGSSVVSGAIVGFSARATAVHSELAGIRTRLIALGNR